MAFNLSVDNLVGSINPDELTFKDIEQTFIIQKNRLPVNTEEINQFGIELKTQLNFSAKYIDAKTGEVIDDPKVYYIFGIVILIWIYYPCLEQILHTTL